VNRALVALLATTSAVVMADDRRVVHFIDLDSPAGMEALQREHPDHVTTVTRILSETPDQLPNGVPGWLRAQFGAREVTYPIQVLKTSDPPKARLSFVLGDTAYQAFITVRYRHPDLASQRKGASQPPDSAAHPEPLERRTVSFPSSRRPGGRER
jgi:hypothetical protein